MIRPLGFLFVIMAGCVDVSGQIVSVGVKAGVPFLDRTSGQDNSRPYLVGPSVEIHLPAGLALEADALYQRVGTSYTAFLFTRLFFRRAFLE